MSPIIHKSDCAVHDAPAYRRGECNCGAIKNRALLLAGLAVSGCVAATIVATVAARDGQWCMAALDGGLLLVLALLAVMNYRLAAQFN